MRNVPVIRTESTKRKGAMAVSMTVSKQTLMSIYARASQGDRNAAREGYAVCVALQKRSKSRRHWSMVRDAVRVRPYALHILENYAMRQEELRIERANNGIIDD